MAGMRNRLAVLIVGGFLVASLGGCMALGGEDYVMSYGVEAETGSNFSPDSYLFIATISGR